jgi:hypothetical protein
MLDAMSKILGFTIEQKQALGLVKKTNILQGAPGQGTSGAQGSASADRETKDLKGVTSSLVNFLMGDDDFD